MKLKKVWKRTISAALVGAMIFNGNINTFVQADADEEQTTVTAEAEEAAVEETVAEEAPAETEASEEEVVTESEEVTYEVAEEQPAEVVVAEEPAAEATVEETPAENTAYVEETQPVYEEPAAATEEATAVVEETTEPVYEEQEAVIEETEEPVYEEEAEAEEEEEEIPEEAAVAYPAATFTGSTVRVAVTASVDEGVFPEGTTMKVTAVRRADALELAEQAVAEDKEVADAIAVDITFYDASGAEIQPAEGKTVNVSMSLIAGSLSEGDNYLVAHDEGNGNAEVITQNATESGSDFTAESFSVYVIISETDPAIATYTFYDGTTQLGDAQKVKDGETVYPPTTPNKEGYVFQGWSYTAGSTTADIAPTESFTARVSATSTVNLYAVWSSEVHVYFLDAEGRVYTTKTGATNDSITTTDVVIPLASTQSVTGWYYDSALTQSAGDSVKLGTTNITLYPKVEEGNYLYFSTGDHGTYIEPQFVAAGTGTTRPTDPTRSGYTFRGWSTSESATTADYNFGSELTEETTIYAVWQANTNTKYTVIHWKENANDDGFSFAESEEKVGTSGQLTAATAKSYQGFTVEAITQQNIAGDGTTIVNVYYKRNIYEVKFYEYTYTYTETTSNSGTQYGIVDGEYVQLYRWVGNYYYNDQRYRGTRYTRSEGWSEIEDLTISAKYEAEIANLWPSRVNSNYSAQWGTRYRGANAEQPYQSGINTMPLNGARFYKVADVSNPRYTMNLNYYVESLDGSYILDHTDSFGSDNTQWNTTEEDHYDITGFTYTGNVPDRSDFTRVGSTNTYEVNFRYSRNSYNINFISNGETTVKTYKYEGNISDADFTPSNGPSGYHFAGWFDNELGAGTAYNFDDKTMPADNITLYAFWSPNTVENTVYLTVSGNDGSTSLIVTYGDTISQSDLPTVYDSEGNVLVQGTDDNSVTIPEGYEWKGWATKNTSGAYILYNFSTVIYSSIELYPHYISTESFTVTYNIGKGTGSVSDDEKYSEESNAVIKSFTGTAPSGKVFLYWTDGTNNYYAQDKITITGNVTLTAVYGDQSGLVNLVYNANDGTGSEYTQVTNGENNTSATAVSVDTAGFTREGYEFVSWNTKADGSGTTIVPGAKIGVDNDGKTIVDGVAVNTLYAQWKPILKITITGSTATYTYDGTEKTNNVYNISYTLGGVATTAEAVGVTVTPATVAVTGTNADTYRTALTESLFTVTGAENYKVEWDVSGNVELIINKRNVTLTSATDSKQYDGKPLTNGTVTVGGDGFANGEGATYNVTGSQTLVGSSANAFTYTLNSNTNANNYTITKTEGTLTVTNRDAKFEVTLEANSGEYTYDGQNHSAIGVKTDTFTIGDVTFTVSGYKTEDPTEKNAGEYSNNITGTYVVKDAAGYDVTAQFSVKTTNGKLTINKKDVTITSATASKEYDGTPLTRNAQSDVTAVGFVDGEGATYNITGSQTIVGSSSNAFSYTLNSNTNADNYNITKTEGTLTVTNRPEKFEVTLVANNGTYTYDGAEHSATGVVTDTFTIGGVTFTVSGYTTEDPTQKNAGEYTNNITGTYVVKDAAGNDVTDQFTVKTINGSLVINKKAVTLKSADKTKEYDGTALVNGDTALAVESGFVDGEGATYSFTGSQTLVGSSANAFSYTLNSNTSADNYNITKTEGTLTVTNRDAKYEVTLVAKSGAYTYDGTEHTAAGVVTDTFEVEGNTYTVSGYETEDPAETNAGTYSNNISGTYTVKDSAGNVVTDQFSVKTQNGSLVINKKDVTLKSADKTKEYDGTALVNGDTALETEDGFVAGEGATYNFTGSQTLVGSSENAFTYTLNEGTLAANYNITKTEGTLTVTNRDAKYEVTLVANSGTYTYDGAEHSAIGVETDKFTINGVEYTVSDYVTENPAKTNAGTYSNNITGTFTVKDASDNDVTDQFSVGTENGSLVINKKAVTLTSATDSKQYDGTPLTNGTVTAEGFVDGEGATYNVTGSQTLVGSSANAFTYTLNEGTLADNYDITKTEGTLTVTNRDTKYEVTLVANSTTATYDGQSHTAAGVVTDIFTVNGNTYVVSGYTTSNPTETNAGTYDNVISGTYVVTDADGNDVTAQFTVNTEDGKLVINKRTVTLTSATASKQYDGTALTRNAQSDVTVGGDGFVSGEGAAYDITGSQTLVGSSPNAFTYTLNEGTLAANYNITKTEGTLEVTNRTTKYEVKLVGNSAEFTYDGEEHSAIGVVTDTFEVEGNTYTVSGYITSDPTEVNAGTYPNTVTVTGAIVKDANDNDVTAQFTVNKDDGQLIINKAEMTDEDAHAEGYEDKYDGADHKGTITAPEGSKYEYTYTVDDEEVTTSEEPSIKNVGTIEVSVKVTNPNYNDKTLTYTLIVTPRNVTITSASDSKEYDGTPLTKNNPDTDITVSVDGFVEGEGATYNITGSQTLVGSSANAFTYELNSGTLASNYNITTVEGDLNVTDRTNKFEVELVANSTTATYDGTEHSAVGVKENEFTFNGVKFIVSGFTTDDPAKTNAGTYANNISRTAVVKDVDENDVTSQFTVSYIDGSLVIDPAKVTLTSATDSKEYDGTPLTNKTVTAEGFIGDDGAEYNVTGTQTVPGSSTNYYTYTLKEGTVAANYDITAKFGTLTVTNRDAKFEVTLVANSGEYTYDGEEHSAVGVETDKFTINGVEFTVSGYETEDPTETNADVYTNNITGTYVVTDPEGNDVTSEFAVSTENGKLVINMREVVLKSASDSKEYDGTPLTNDTVTAEGFVGDDGASYDVTGSQTLVGSSDNIFTYELNEGVNAQNYTFMMEFGRLEVTDRTNKFEVELVANSTTTTYDGKEHSAIGVETDKFTFNGVEFTVSGYTTEDPAETNAGTYTNNISGTYVVTDPEGNDVTDQFTVKTTDGSLEIAKAKLVIKVGEYSKYVGEKDPEVTATVSGLVDGETLDDSAFTVQRVKGETVGDYTISVQLTKDSSLLDVIFTKVYAEGTADLNNYDVSLINGVLHIVANPVPGESTPTPGPQYHSCQDVGYSDEYEWSDEANACVIKASTQKAVIPNTSDEGLGSAPWFLGGSLSVIALCLAVLLKSKQREA